ncbi:hypothetical protein AB1E18_009512 [Capra hircus]
MFLSSLSRPPEEFITLKAPGRLEENPLHVPDPEPRYAVPKGVEGDPPFSKLSRPSDNDDSLSSTDEAELDEEAAKYHQEDWGFLAQEKGASTSKDDLIECLKNLTVALQSSGIKLPISNSKSPSAPPLPPAYAPSIIAGLDPPPGAPPPPPSEIMSLLQKALKQAQRLGNPLPPVSGNWVRGQPLAPKQCYGATLQVPKEPLQTSVEPQEAAQDWTSVPPPTQY